MIRLSIHLIVGLVFAGCSRTGLDKTVKMRSYVAESAKGCAYDSLNCSRFSVNYPEFPGLNEKVQASISRSFVMMVRGDAEDPRDSFELLGEGFLKDYADFRKDFPDWSASWQRNIDVSLLLLGDSLLSLQYTEESYTGGAHGNNLVAFINLDPKTGEVIKLDRLLKPGYKEALRALGEEIFRTNRELADTASFENNGFQFTNNRFALNDNYGFSREGISFYFNSYEVAPYSMGPTEVMIPYERISSWIK
jgi:hypothetical protein